jgi:hypothetical protein
VYEKSTVAFLRMGPVLIKALIETNLSLVNRNSGIVSSIGRVVPSSIGFNF